MFILYKNKLVDVLLNVPEHLTCKRVKEILINGTEEERDLIHKYDKHKSSIKVQRKIKRNQIEDDYYDYIKDILKQI